MSATAEELPLPPSYDGAPFEPSRWRVAREALVYLQLPRLFGRRVPQPELPTGVPVMLLPGFLAGDWSLRVLANRLRRRGHRTVGSGLAVNADCTQALVDRLEQRLVDVAAAEGGRIALVGHSRGGMLGKLIALRRPDLVAGLVTVCSPHLEPLAASAATLKQAELLVRLSETGLPRVLGADCLRGDCADWTREQLRLTLPDPVAFTSVYSRGDGVVDWRACLDPSATQVEVSGSHNGVATNAVAHHIVQRHLAALFPLRTP